MSKPNEKTTPAPQAQAASGTGDLAVVQSAPPAQEPKAGPDKDHGRGGLYTVVNGVRQRVGGTEHASVTKEKTA